MFVISMAIRLMIVTFVTTKESWMLRLKHQKNFLGKLWKLLSRKENWESRMGWEYFALVFVGGLLAGLFNWI